MTTHPSSSASRWLASALLLVAAGAHVPLIDEHLQEAPYVGVLFIALSVVYVALAGAMLLAESGTTWLLAGATALAAIVAYLVSRTIGLPQIRDDIGNWTEALSLPALASEVLLVVTAGAHFIRARRPPVSASSPHLRKAAL